VAFVVIGGFAAVLHGSTLTTDDLDITPAATADNLERLSAAPDPRLQPVSAAVSAHDHGR
jgi:hypothetical protein